MVIVNNFPEATTLPSNIFIRVFFLRVRYKYVSHEVIYTPRSTFRDIRVYVPGFSSTFRLLSHPTVAPHRSLSLTLKKVLALAPKS